MKKEDKDLLLKDLCMRLPYGVKIQQSELIQCFTLGAVSADTLYLKELHDWTYLEWCKPYLRPMSSMTEEEEDEYEKFIRGSYEQQMEFYLRKHIDFRGLIPKGLAIEAPKDMYNEIEEE